MLNFSDDFVNFDAPMVLQVSTNRTTAMRKPKSPQANRARILAAATAAFAALGYGGASMDAIAARTQTTRAMINYYFGSKEQLYLAVLEQVYAEIREAEGGARTRPPGSRSTRCAASSSSLTTTTSSTSTSFASSWRRTRPAAGT